MPARTNLPMKLIRYPLAFAITCLAVIVTAFALVYIFKIPALLQDDIMDENHSHAEDGHHDDEESEHSEEEEHHDEEEEHHDESEEHTD